MDTLDQIVADQPRRYALAKLIGYCEGLAATGVLGEAGELHMRMLVINACNALNIPTKAERGDPVEVWPQ